MNFFNDENLGGLEVVLAYDVATLVCDSVSFASTTAPGSQVSRIDTLNGTIIAAIFLLDAPSIPPQTGLFAELYLSPVGAPQPMMIFIDTTSIILDTITTRRTLFSSSNPAASIFPEYAGGVGEALPYVAGDANSDGKVNIADVTYLISWLFSAGPDPPNRAAADPNASCNVNIADVTFLISRIFAFGPAPKAGCAT
ncbi:MAG: dockerin type I repeat-containing protein [Candidatus Zixiibacteriota bacterium]